MIARGRRKPVTVKALPIGIARYADFKARTMAIARGELVPAPGDPKLWFSLAESLLRALSAADPSRQGGAH